MEGGIFFEGIYGATRQYAEWLAHDLQLPLTDVGKDPNGNAPNYDFLLIGTPVYYGSLKIMKWLRHNLRVIGHKKLFFFIVTATAEDETKERAEIIHKNIPEEIRNRAEVYFLRGRLIHKKLSWKHRFMLKLFSLMIKDPVKRAAVQADFDEVKKENIARLINAVHSFQMRGEFPMTGQKPFTVNAVPLIY